MKQKCRPYLLGSLLPLSAILMWVLAARNNWSHSSLFVSPIDLLRCARQLAANGELLVAFLASMARYLFGVLSGIASGLLVGVLLGLSAQVRQMIGPTLRTLQQISLFAWIPLIMAWFGLAETSKIVFIALAAFFPMLVNTFEGVGSTPRASVEVARVHCFNRLHLLQYVVLPAALPSIFTGIQLALIYAWLATLGAEYLLTSGAGLGSLLVDAQEQYQMDKMLLGILLISAIGFLLGTIADRLEARLMPWRTA